jgi:hypothetical protein
VSYVPRVEQKHPNDRTHIWEHAAPHREPAPVPDRDWPRMVYKRGSVSAEQVDHPGNVTKVVSDAAALDAAVADGWSLTPIPTE